MEKRNAVGIEELEGSKKEVSLYEGFVGMKYLECDYMIEGLLMGYNSVQDKLRRGWMAETIYSIEVWTQNPKLIISDDTKEDILEISKAFVYFIEMNQDNNNQLLLDGFKNFIAHYTSNCDRYATDKSVEFFIPELKDMHPITQMVTKYIFGELLLLFVNILIKNNKKI